jgi:hypothetical protein
MSTSSIVIENQPTNGTAKTTELAVAPTEVVPAVATAPAKQSCLSIVWKAVFPCCEIAIDVGSDAAQKALHERLANNSSLTPEQKEAIVRTVGMAIEHQGKITTTAINHAVDGATTKMLLAQLAQGTLTTVTAAAKPLIEVGSKEAQDAIALRLDGTSLPEAQQELIARAVGKAIGHFGSTTVDIIDNLVDKAVAKVVLAELVTEVAATHSHGAEAAAGEMVLAGGAVVEQSDT